MSRRNDCPEHNVDQITHFHDEVEPGFLKLFGRRIQLCNRLTIEAAAGRWLVGVMQICDESDSQ